jgi:hypothetical protein
MPRPVFVHNLGRPLASPARVGYCDSFACRLQGLMLRAQLAQDEGLLLVEKRDARLDSAIHMLFVRFDLAVFWLNSGQRVVDKVLARAWHPVYVPKAPARFILELHPARWDDYQIGDAVEIKNA